jgi:NAD(P)-dependent dehydrogenase (short-subunit alcohol dehydrogenase family)
MTSERNAVLVTGGNSGIGLECARTLARAGRRVLIAGRNQAASAQAVREIGAECGEGRAEAVAVDLGSVASVHALARDIAARDVPLDALVCNAGLQQLNGAQRFSTEGYELTFAANHLGHFLLVNLLLERLAASAPARIVVVASGVHDPKQTTGMPKPKISDIETLARTGGPRAGEFDGRLAYVNSKLCNLWFAYELVRRMEAAGIARDGRAITVNAFDPGLVPGSGLARDYPRALRFAWERVMPGLANVLSPLVAGISTKRKSGAALARLVLDPALANVTGKYFPSHTRWCEAPSSDFSYDAPTARALWEKSIEMCRLAPGASPLLPG